MSDEGLERGMSSLWTSVNHVALVVKDVGRSLSFYSDIIGMKQVMRPNFDRYIDNTVKLNSKEKVEE